MQDRFRFRVWKGKENRMVYGVTYLNPLLLDSTINPENEHNILMQCTGMKDKNDNLIYEGDIVKTHNSVIVKIIFYKGCFSFTDGVYNQACYWNKDTLEVIGNIYEHSDKLNPL